MMPEPDQQPPIIAEIHNEGTIAIETTHPLYALLEKCGINDATVWDELVAVEPEIKNTWASGGGLTFIVVNVEAQASQDQTFRVYRLRAVSAEETK